METVLDMLYSILNTLEQIDQSILLSVNSAHCPFFDKFMFWVSDKWIWIPIYIAMIYAIIKDKQRETLFIAIGIVLTILLCDQFASGLCKPLFHRFRPCQDPVIGSMVHTVCGFKCDLYGFMSSHAANTVGLAMFTTLLFKNRIFGCVIWLWALLNCYSRMYLGVHYLGDIICGALFGMLFAWLCFLLYSKVFLAYMPHFRYSRHKNNSRANVDFPTSDLVPFFWTFFVTLFVISIFSASNMFSC
ncbi:MAG: phosphatase PAP2 family protein [Paludibacteraceae bacterium]|nr:phosphatase PAP2 family protein [Paludibacteraceae bacterium]